MRCVSVLGAKYKFSTYFYVDRYGDCYRVDATRKLPRPEYDVYTRKEYDLWVDILFYLPLILVGILL